MHVFVTGATGFIGFHTVLALLEAGHTVRLGVRNLEKMNALYEAHGIEITDYALGEITDKKAVDAALQGCDAVVHTAAMVSLDANLAEQMYHTNVTGTKLVIGGAVEQGIESIVHVSSAAAVFDRFAPVVDESLPLAEQTSAYGRSKSDSEKFVRGLISEGARVAITYPSSVLGPQDPAMSEGNQGIAIFFNQTFVKTSSGMQIIDVRDLARVHVALLEDQSSGSYLVSGHFRSWDELGDTLDRVTGRTLRKFKIPGWMLRGLGAAVDFSSKYISFDTLFTGEAAMYGTQWVYVDDRKVREALAIRYLPLETTLADTIRWLADAGHIEAYWAERLDKGSDL
ncbi:MAG: SDR family NAD(P)-dependent oxidoreductase [Halioglobus sp.]